MCVAGCKKKRKINFAITSTCMLLELKETKKKNKKKNFYMPIEI